MRCGVHGDGGHGMHKNGGGGVCHRMPDGQPKEWGVGGCTLPSLGGGGGILMKTAAAVWPW